MFIFSFSNFPQINEVAPNLSNKQFKMAEFISSSFSISVSILNMFLAVIFAQVNLFVLVMFVQVNLFALRMFLQVNPIPLVMFTQVIIFIPIVSTQEKLFQLNTGKTFYHQFSFYQHYFCYLIFLLIITFI